MTTPRVTIGVPVCNGQEYLSQTLESLLGQSYRDFRIVIGDNASTDATGEIARRFAEQDSRIHYIRHPMNLGAAVNYNRLFAMAESEYFRWSAADDLVAPSMLEQCVEELDQHSDVVLAYPRVILIGREGEVLESYEEGLHLPQERASDRFFGLLKHIRLCNALYGLLRSAAVRKTRPLGSYRGSDIVFQAELALHGKFSELSGTSFYRRMHPRAFHEMSPEAQRRFYYPERREGVEFRIWRLFWEHHRSLVAAPIGARERIRILGGLARAVIASRNDLWQELVTAAFRR